ncbi:MAG: acyl-CoA thioesterase [SAR324 cluster bacterium]|nr:acyl-CoA thioesterase [SAR324 cluster bacterium]
MEQRPMKTPADSKSYIAEIVGEESRFGQRMDAGSLLHMMDLVAATAAWKHTGCHVVTLAFDRVELLNIICHMDYVRYDACVIKVGRSSLVVRVDGFSKPPTEMELQATHSGVITMVAVDENKRPNRDIPGMSYQSEEDLANKFYAEQRDTKLAQNKIALTRIDQLDEIGMDQLKDLFPRQRRYTPSQTELITRKLFLPRHVNALGNIFGGEIIELMEELAIANARQFTGNFNVVTIAMEDVLFLKPIQLDHLVEMKSVVTFVGKTTLTIEVSVRALDGFHPENGYITNNGIFTILNYDRSGQKKFIKTGLDLQTATLAHKKTYLRELFKYQQNSRA